MADPTPTLDVYANPYHAIDGAGRPSGACPRDRLHDRPGYVGASFDAVDVETLPAGSAASPRQTTIWTFEPGAVRVPDLAYYRERIADGSLLVGTPDEVEKARAATRDAALARFRARTGREPVAASPYGAEPSTAPQPAAPSSPAAPEAQAPKSTKARATSATAATE